MILLVFVPLLRDLGADEVGHAVRRRGRIQVEPQGKPAGAQDVLRRGHAAADQRRQPLRPEGGQDVFGVVEMEDHPTPCGRPERAAHDGQHEFRAPPADLRRGDRARGCPQHGSTAPAPLEVIVDAAHDTHQARVALRRIRSPHHQAVMCQREAHGPR